MTLHFLISAPVFMQVEMRDLAKPHGRENQKLPSRYFALFHRWFLFGIPGFGSVMAILWLTIVQTALGRHERR